MSMRNSAEANRRQRLTASATPGPWVARGTNVYLDSFDLTALASIAVCKRRQHAPVIKMAEAQANARLIASSLPSVRSRRWSPCAMDGRR